MEEEFNQTINAELFDNDLDNIGWEPETISEADSEAAEQFGYE